MAVSKLNPVSSIPVPAGAGTLVASGLATAGVYSANLSAGTYSIQCSGAPSQNYYSGYTLNSSTGITKKIHQGIIPYGTTTYVNLAANDTQFTIMGQPSMNKLVGITSSNNTQSLTSNGSGKFWMSTNNGTNHGIHISTDYCNSWGDFISSGLVIATHGAINWFGYINSVLYMWGASGWYVRSTDDGATWSTPAQVGTTSINRMAWNGTTYVISCSLGGTSSNVYSSTNGTTWTNRTVPTITPRGLTWGNGLFVIGGNSGVIITSPDGTTWTSRTSGVTATLSQAVYGNGVYCMASSNLIISSPDGITWTTRYTGQASGNDTFIIPSNPGFFIYGGGYFWLFSTQNHPSHDQYAKILVSTNGTTWSQCMVAAPDISAASPGNIVSSYMLATNSPNNPVWDNGLYTVSTNNSSAVPQINKWNPMYVNIYSITNTNLN